jgi:hypothetical protein
MLGMELTLGRFSSFDESWDVIDLRLKHVAWSTIKIGPKKKTKSQYEWDEGNFHLGIKEKFHELWKFIIIINLKPIKRYLLHKKVL